MKVTITTYNSKHFPVKLIWNNGRNFNVFPTREQAIGYAVGRFGAIEITENKENGND